MEVRKTHFPRHIVASEGVGLGGMNSRKAVYLKGKLAFKQMLESIRHACGRQGGGGWGADCRL